ncbi:MAG: hypothetical protein WBB28_26415 [Crinalium sp.]
MRGITFCEGDRAFQSPNWWLAGGTIRNTVRAIALDSVMGVGTTFTVSIPNSQLRGQIQQFPRIQNGLLNKSWFYYV